MKSDEGRRLNRPPAFNVYQDIMTRSNQDHEVHRYQVLVDNEPVHGFVTKPEARAYMRACRKRGVTPSLWDVYDNPISNLLRM